MKRLFSLLSIGIFFLSSCSTPQPTTTSSKLNVLVVESFLGDIVHQVAGDEAEVQVLIPLNLDPHAYEPTPQDVAKIAQAQVLVINGSGLEEWLTDTLANVPSSTLVIDASKGLTPRKPSSAEIVALEHPESDPHFWLDPTLAVRYVENIRDGFISVDPSAKNIFNQNAAGYIDQLNQLDSWINEQVDQIPAKNRLLVTNHESFGYYADRYGFTILGAIIPSVSTSASPSAAQLADLVTQIRKAGAPAIFLETGANPQLAEQVASETGVKVVTGLFTHSLTDAEGSAPSYIEMMRYDTHLIVSALK